MYFFVSSRCDKRKSPKKEKEKKGFYVNFRVRASFLVPVFDVRGEKGVGNNCEFCQEYFVVRLKFLEQTLDAPLFLSNTTKKKTVGKRFPSFSSQLNFFPPLMPN